MHQYATLADTVYFWFAANDAAGSGADGSTPVYDVRLAGAAADAAPVLSGSATLLTHANYPAGAHEVAIAATAGNGFAAGNTYAVFCTLLVDSQNPTGFVGSFTLGPVPANMLKVAGTDQSAGDLYTAITAIGIVGTQVAYTASSLSVTKGDQDIVTLSNAASHDDTYIEIGEISGGAGGFDFEFTKATSETTEIPAELHVSGFYNGSTAHYVQVYIWNYSLAVPAYELAGIMNTRSAEYDYTFPLTVDNHNASTGEMKVRFLHVGTTGNNSHYIRINLLQWDKQVTDSETASAIAAIKAKTDRLQFTTADNVKADADTIKTQAVTCDAAVTVLASVGTAATSTAQTGDAFARLGAPAGASVSADIAALPTAAEVSAQVMADFSEQNYVYYVFGAP